MQWISDTPCHNQGVQAVFAVTNFWEHAFTGSTPLESRDKEAEQGMQAFTVDSSFPHQTEKQHGLSILN